MSKNFWKIVNKVIGQADILLLLLDARAMENSRNIELEKKIKDTGKPLIYVINKSDLVDKKELEYIRFKPFVLFSSTKHFGVTKLRNRIHIEGKKAYKEKESYTVAVLGYPNVGKSSLINAMKGKKSAPTSSVSGFTKGIQKIKIDNRILFLDTPGVIPYNENDDNKHSAIGTLEFSKVKDPVSAAMKLIENYPGKIENHFKVKEGEDYFETIETIAKKKNLLKKGAEPDIDRAAKMILKEWQTGKIK